MNQNLWTLPTDQLRRLARTAAPSLAEEAEAELEYRAIWEDSDDYLATANIGRQH